MMSKLLLSGLSCCLLFALGRCDAGDASVLLQATVSKGIPDEPEEDAPKGKGRDDKGMEPEEYMDPIKIGERMEIIVLEGPQAGEWLSCKVVREGEAPNTYDVTLSGVGKRRFVPNVPVKALRRPLEMEKSDGVLLFWAVSSRPYVMNLVKKNIKHLRSTYSGRADVYLVHYDGNKADWLDANETWYKENVQFSEERQLPKRQSSVASMLFAQEYYPPQISFARKLAPELLARRQYDWVWLLDEDLDFSETDLTKLFDDAATTESPIVAPSVKFEDRYRTHPETKMYLAGCSFATPMCAVHMPKACQYRYVNYIEAMFPMMRPAVLTELATCTSCHSAIDRLWCARVARTLEHPPEEACAILDKVTVTHTNGKTLRKWEQVGGLHDTIQDVRKNYPTDYVDGGDFGDFRCVH